MSAYPLGSFSRFGHQARWASERRHRAQVNSALTRQIKAEEHLEREQALVEVFQKLLDAITPTGKEAEQAVCGQVQAIDRARQKHAQGKRAHYGVFGGILRWFLKITNSHTSIQQYDREEMKDVLIDLADRHLSGEQVLVPKNQQ